MKNDNKGFSLIELIVVIAIMAILVGALAPQFVKYIEKTNVSTDMQNVAQLKTAVEVYAIDQATTSTGLSNSVLITVTGDSTAKAVVSGGNSVTADQLGIPSLTVNLKSKKWPASTTYTFNNASNTWNTPTGGFANDGKDMDTIFK